MTRKIKNCGSCSGFLKMKILEGSSGLCIEYDKRTDSGSGHNCKLWKGIPYKYRAKNKIVNLDEKD